MNITSLADASDREKFQKWAETLEKAIGNPLYHWSHLELRKYFGYEGVFKWRNCRRSMESYAMQNWLGNSIVCSQYY